MSTISASVGRGGVNKPADVRLVQQCLIRHADWLDTPAPAATGMADQLTLQAISGFQKNAAALQMQDGKVSQNGFTIRQLLRIAIPRPRHSIFRPVCFAHALTPLSDADFATAAAIVGCEAEAIKAVARVEGTDWDRNGGPGILFERHKFSKHTKHAYDITHNDISNRSSGGYGLIRMQYSRLYRAAVLDEVASLKSASWGKFQILGENHDQAGFRTVTAFVDAMMKSEQEHLSAFATYCSGDKRLKKALADCDWATLAKIYNGPSYVENQYDIKLESAYKDAKAANQTAQKAQ